jgi:hypothetical protein
MVDGTDYPIKELCPFSKKWFSHKFKGPGLQYDSEVAVCINCQTGTLFGSMVVIPVDNGLIVRSFTDH